MPSDIIDENPTTSSADLAPVAGSRRLARLIWQVVAAAVIVLIVRALLMDSFYASSGSMEPGIAPGDRLLVSRLYSEDDLHRGDLIVFDGTTVFGGPDRSPPQASGIVGDALHGIARAVGVDLGEKDYLKRIVGIPGDRVTCCTAAGRLSVNGVEVSEPYLPSGMVASQSPFDVRVPMGKVFVLGDNRADSADSRAHLGDPGGGMVPVGEILGEATFRYWPAAQGGPLPSTDVFSDIPEATS
ncbi:MAG: signal peptidase I [Nostocoides sp.]